MIMSVLRNRKTIVLSQSFALHLPCRELGASGSARANCERTASKISSKTMIMIEVASDAV